MSLVCNHKVPLAETCAKCDAGGNGRYGVHEWPEARADSAVPSSHVSGTDEKARKYLGRILRCGPNPDWQTIVRVASYAVEALQNIHRGSSQAMSSDLRTWMRNNMTFYNTAESDGPVLGSVSKRIWYHATDDMESYPFDSVIDAAIAEARADSAVPSSHVSETDEQTRAYILGGPAYLLRDARVLREALARLIERSAEVSRVLFETNLDMRYGLLAQRRALDDELIAARSALAQTQKENP